MTGRPPIPIYGVQAVGLLLLATAWWGISGTGRLETQVDWLVLAVAALLVSLASCLGWLFVGHRRIALRRVALAAAVSAKFGEAPTVVATAGTDLVATPAMTRYHRAGCQLTRGKDVRAEQRRVHEHAGRTPCGVCRP